ncbi:unnamed protein product, partial [Prorocentrum cordatum]
MCPTPSCRAGKQWDWNWRIIKNGGACSVCGQAQQLYSPKKKKDTPKGGSPKGPGPAVPAASSPAIFSPWGKAKLINQLEALVQQDASVTASVLAIKLAVETPALPRSRTPLEQLQSTEAKAKQAATNAHNFLSEIANLETRLEQARKDYDQAMEELVDAEEAHEAAVLAYNKDRAQTAPEVKPESVPDFLAAYEDKLKSIAIDEYEDGEAKDKLQTALTAMDEAKDQAAAVIHAVQTALEGVKLAAAQAEGGAAVGTATGAEGAKAAAAAAAPAAPSDAEAKARASKVKAARERLEQSAAKASPVARRACRQPPGPPFDDGNRSELRGISDIGVGTFDFGLRQPPSGPIYGDGDTSEVRGIASSVEVDSVGLESRQPPSGPLFGGGGTCELRGIFSDIGVVVSDLGVRQPPPGPLYGDGGTSEVRGIVSSVEVGPFDLETRHPPSGPLFGDGGTCELRGIFSSSGVGSVGSDYRRPPSGPLLGDGGTRDIGVGVIYFGVMQPPSGPLYGDGDTSELCGIVSSDDGVPVYYGEWQPPSGPLFGDGDTSELRGVSSYTAPHRAGASLFFANVTEWGPRIRQFVVEHKSKYGMMAFVKTHVTEAELIRYRASLDVDGWKLSACAAVGTGRSAEGTSGDEWVLARSHLATASFDRQRALMTKERLKDPCRGWVPIVWHLRVGNLMVIAAYFLPKHGFGGLNLHRWASLRAFLASVSDPWIIVADWNLTPTALGRNSFLKDVGGTIVLPDVRVTCDKGAGSLNAVASVSVADLVSVKGVLTVPWKVHCGLHVEIQGTSTAWWHRALVLPRPLPAVDRPPTAPDPQSKTYQRKQAALQRRKEALPPDHQDAFHELHQPPDLQGLTGDVFEVSLDRWNSNSPSGADGDGCPKYTFTAEMRMISESPIVSWALEGNDQLSQDYGKWVHQVEQSLLDPNLTAQERAPFTGRARGLAVTWKKSVSSPGRGVHSLTSDQMVEGSCQVVVAVEAVAACEVARGIGKARKAYADWDATVVTTPRSFAANAVADPIAIMANKSTKWGKIWSDAVDTPASIIQALSAIRHKAAEEDIPPLHCEQLQAAIRVTGNKKARGVDGLGAGDLGRLPTHALEELRDLFQRCEAAQAWPLQLAATLSALAPKPSGEGDRVLGMVPLPVKLWSR